MVGTVAVAVAVIVYVCVCVLREGRVVEAILCECWLAVWKKWRKCRRRRLRWRKQSWGIGSAEEALPGEAVENADRDESTRLLRLSL